MRRNCLSLLKQRSIRFRSRYKSLLKAWVFFAPLRSGMIGTALSEQIGLSHPARSLSSPLKKALLTGFHSTAKHNATKAVSPSSETMRTI